MDLHFRTELHPNLEDGKIKILEARYSQSLQISRYIQEQLPVVSSVNLSRAEAWSLQEKLVEIVVSHGLFREFNKIFELLKKANYFETPRESSSLENNYYKLAFLAWVCRDYETAISQACRGISKDPSNGNCYWIGSLACLTAKKYTDAFLLASSGISDTGDPRLHSYLKFTEHLISNRKIADVVAWDLNFRFHLTAFNGQALDASIQHLSGIFCESDELDYIQNYFSDKPPIQGIVEVGSLVGSHSCFYLKKLQPKYLYIFDASSQSVKYTILNLALNQVSCDKTLYSVCHKAVGDSEKQVQFFDESVQQVSLDSENFSAKVEFMKIDVDGGEINVLNGAKNLIQRDRPHIFVEVQDINLNSLVAFLQENRYRVEKIFERPNELNLMLSPAS